MLKSFIILIFMLITMSSVYAKQYITGTVKGVEIGAEDENGSNTLCITYIYSSERERTYGIVEDLQECYYAQEFSKSIGQEKRIPSGFLFPLYDELDAYLVMKKEQVRYYYREVE